MVTKSYGIDLQLPLVPDGEPGAAYTEFASLYKILNQLQDAISSAAGLVSLVPGDSAGAGILELFGLNRYNYLLFEAGTNIVAGAPCQVYNVGGVAKVRQPPLSYLVSQAGGGNDGGRECAEAAGYMPLFSVSAGQMVAVAGTGAVALATGAVKGSRYSLNTSMALQGSAGDVTHFLVQTNVITIRRYMYMGYCIENGVLLCFPGYFWRIY